MRRAAVVAAVFVGLAALSASAAHAYEYEVRARTIGQAFQLRSFRLAGADLLLPRRRFVQSLMLDIHDIGDLGRRRHHRRPHAPGPVISFTSYLRLDHDFGDWTMGELQLGDRILDANDAIPELTSSSLALDLLYAYVTIDGLAAGAVDLKIGRQVRMDLLDAWAFDGVTTTVHTPWPVAFEVAGGLRVRDASPLGAAVHELDGTTGAGCREYVEAAAAGAGSWQIIDRSRVPGGSRFTADLDYCPQREQIMPTFGVAVETEGLRAVHARLSYRRSMSETVGLIGEVDRLDFPDQGLYPNESGQAPGWGVNEERLALVVHGLVERADRRVLITPFAGARWSLLHGMIDEAIIGARVRLGAHAIEPEVARSVPTFDGDSIFSVFATEPSTDLRLGYVYGRRGRALGARAGVWLRRYNLGDGAGATAGGATAGAHWRGKRVRLGLDGLIDGGYGGGRVGLTASAGWQASARSLYSARAGVIGLAPDDSAAVDFDQRAVLGSLQVGATWQVVRGVAVHTVVEGSSSRAIPAQLRMLGVVDLAFVPEVY